MQCLPHQFSLPPLPQLCLVPRNPSSQHGLVDHFLNHLHPWFCRFFLTLHKNRLFRHLPQLKSQLQLCRRCLCAMDLRLRSITLFDLIIIIQNRCFALTRKSQSDPDLPLRDLPLHQFYFFHFVSSSAYSFSMIYCLILAKVLAATSSTCLRRTAPSLSRRHV